MKKLTCSVCQKKFTAVEESGTLQAYCKKCRNLEIACPKCGKPIVNTTEYGMFCEDWCGREEAIAFDKKLDELIDILDEMFP